MIHKSNIILIGMPGCGKSTIGKMLAQFLRKYFCDIDEWIESLEGKSIKDIFINGEEYFRKIEREAVKEISAYENYVISTGGGVIKSEENMKHLSQKGMILFIHRPIQNIIEDIETDERPLLKKGKEQLYKLYKERYPLYCKYSDHTILNDGSIEQVLQEMIQAIKGDEKH